MTMTRNMKLNIVNHNLPLPVLPDELILEIFLRLPVTSLFRFKCVSKSWKTLISCPQFAKTHLQISTTKPRLTDQQLLFSVFSEHEIQAYPIMRPLFLNPLTQDYPNMKPLFLNPLTLHEPVSFTVITKDHIVVGSCNGLLCLYHRSQRCFRLYNPSIRFKSKKSPEFQPLNWTQSYYGFGYDQVNDKYKVLLVVHNANDYLTKIYTFGEGSWKTIPNAPCTPIERLGKFVSGTLNWIVDSNQKVILSFDLEKETYGEVLLPQSEGDYICIDMLHVLSNCLCVCFLTKTHWVVWLMKEYGVVESWTKLMIIPYEKFVWNSLENFYHVKPLFISENDIVLIGRELSPRFVLYNLNNGELKYRWASRCLGFGHHIYKESLISPRW